MSQGKCPGGKCREGVLTIGKSREEIVRGGQIEGNVWGKLSGVG